MIDMLEVFKNHSEVKEKVFEKMQETFGPLPTYTLETDSFGRVASVKQDKPKFTVIHGAAAEKDAVVH